MPADTLFDLVMTSLVTGAVGALLWTRLNRLEAGQDEIRAELARVREQMATRTELAGVREQMGADLGGVREQMATRGDLDRLRDEMAVMRSDLAVMRSDLTHVALVVGANRPKPMEG